MIVPLREGVYLRSKVNVYLCGRVKASRNKSKNINGKREG